MSSRLQQPDAGLIGVLCSQFCLGVYTTTFALYMHIKRQRKSALGIVGYGIVALFSLTAVAITVYSVQQFYVSRRGIERVPWATKANAVASVLGMTVDFLSQLILIYRCWQVWGRASWVAITPGVLALASWACGLAPAIDIFHPRPVAWWRPLGFTALTLSLSVNVIVSGLMIARICRISRRTTAHMPSTGFASRPPLQVVVSTLLESAVAILVAQTLYLVLYKFSPAGFSLVAGPVTITYGLNCTAIMVRVAMRQTCGVISTTASPSAMAFAMETGDKGGASGEVPKLETTFEGIGGESESGFRRFPDSSA